MLASGGFYLLNDLSSTCWLEIQTQSLLKFNEVTITTSKRCWEKISRKFSRDIAR